MLIVPMLRMGTIGMLETMIVPTLLRGNAAQDAPRPLSNVTRNDQLPLYRFSILNPSLGKCTCTTPA